MKPCPIDLRPLADVLPLLPAEAAATSRVACDARFTTWWRRARPDAAAPPDCAPAPRWATPRGPLLSWRVLRGGAAIECLLHGAEWPLAAQVAAIADPRMRLAVADALLASTVPPAWVGGGRLRSTRLQARDAPPAGPCLVLPLPAGRLYVERADPDLLGQLAEELAACPPSPAPGRAVGTLRLALRCILMERAFPPAALAALRPGDLIVLAPWSPGQAWHCRLRIGSGAVMEADAHLHPDAGQDRLAATSGWLAAGEDAEAGAGIELGELAELQVAVQFELDAARLTLAELTQMGPGYVVELATPAAQAPVRLVCQGQVIGDGQLVAVGQHLAVRIQRIGVRHADAAER